MATGNILDLCRLCGTDTLSMSILRHNIFDDEGQLKKFAEKISSCLPVNVAEEDPLPKIMCGECAYKLDLLSEFREKSAKTESALMVLLKQDIKHEASDVEEQTEVKEATETVNLKRQSSRRSVKTRRYFVDSESEEDTQQSDDDFHCDDNYRDDDDEDSEIAEPVKKKERRSMPTRASKKTNNKKAALEKEEITAEKVMKDESPATSLEGKRLKSKYLCKICKKEFSKELTLQKHESMEHTFLCVACNVPFMSSRDRGIHKCFSSFQEDYSQNSRGRRTARSKVLTCEQCKKTYSSHANFVRHVAEPHTHHCKVCNIYFATQRQRLAHGCRPAPQPEGTLPDASTKYKYQCSKCAKGFVQETNYLEHIAKAHDSFCKTCKRYFISARDRIAHSCLYKCRHCDFSAKTHTKLQVHIENIHENGIEFECDICKEKFLSKRSLISHIVASGIDHSFIGTYCSICNYDYRSMYSLKLHIQRVHQGVFKCTGCNTSFATKEERKVHYKANHSQKKQEVQCPECPKIISNIHNLQIHINMVHRKLRPHLCQVCGKSYPCKSSLQFHMTMHTGEKKHVCNVCGHAFARIENLKQHMRIHNNVKPFLCDFCPQKFRQAGSLKIHRRIHTGETPYHCHLCPKKYISNGLLKNHLKYHPVDRDIE
ncbi:zinc finger protein ZFP2-like isoform X1 [Cloeon dipterum]|uniref:zinc finger protein ZFP2-like isoform X1 n=1 Tax=Cloeon dipterum TaxID=197152 RepID=UPI0032203A38